MTVVMVTFALRGLAPAQAPPVTLSPIPQFVSYLQNGEPNAFGCVFTYASGTVTPLATYTDGVTGTANSNPVILTAGGTANIWIQAGQSYTFAVYSAGGTNCVSGAMQYTVNGIGGTSSYNSTTVTPSGGSATFTATAQNQLFLLTLNQNVTSLALTAVGVTAPGWLTFQITQQSPGSYTFSWPSNVSGGCAVGPAAGSVTTQSFVWNGTNAYAVGPCTTGSGPSIDTGAISASGNITSTTQVSAPQLVSTVASGTAPLVVTSPTEVANLNANYLLGCTWAAPCGIGTSAPAAGIFTALKATTNFVLGSSPFMTGIQGTDTNLLSSGTMSGSPGATLCLDSNNGATTSGCGPGVSKINYGSSSSVCSTTSAAYPSAGYSCTTTVSWNSSFADTNYYAVCSGQGPSGNPFVQAVGSYTNSYVIVTIVNGENSGATVSTFATLQCIGIHP